MVRFDDADQALLYLLRSLVTTGVNDEVGHLHRVLDTLRRGGKISYGHIRVMQHYAERNRVPRKEGREYKASLLWKEVVDLMRPHFERVNWIEGKKWWQV